MFIYELRCFLFPRIASPRLTLKVIKNELDSASNANWGPYDMPDSGPDVDCGRDGGGKGDGNPTHEQRQSQAAWQDRYKKLRPHLHTMRNLLAEGISNLVPTTP